MSIYRRLLDDDVIMNRAMSDEWLQRPLRQLVIYIAGTVSITMSKLHTYQSEPHCKVAIYIL